MLDSFDELTDRNPAFTNMLMKYIAESLVTSNLFLILSGRKKILTGRNDTLLRNLTKTLELTRFRLTDDVVEELLLSRRQSADRAKMLQCSEDDVILSEGEVNSEMYKIISGRAVCYLGYGTDDEYLIGTLKEGQCFGEYSLLTAKPGICTFVAYTDMLLLRVDREEFSRFIEMNTDNALGIMRNMANMINVLKVNIDMLREEALQRT